MQNGLISLLLVVVSLLFSKESLPIQNTEKLLLNYEEATKEVYFNPDSTSQQLRRYLGINPKLHDSIAQYAYLKLNRVERIRRNFSEAFEYADMALKAAETIKDSIMISICSQDLGDFYTEFGKEEMARELLLSNLRICKTLFNQGNTGSGRVTGAHFHLAKHYKAFSHYQLALQHLDSCETIGKANGHIRIYDSYHRAELARVLTEIGEIDSAQYLLHELDAMITNRLDDPKTYDHVKGLLSVINYYLGDTYSKQNNFIKAITFYEKSININQKYKRYNSLQNEVYKSLAEAEFELKRFKKAYQSLNESKKLRDETFSITSKQNSSLIEVKSDYRKQIEKQQLTLLEKDKDLAEKSRRIILIQGLLIGFSLLLIIGLLAFRAKRQRRRFNAEKTESEKRQKEADKALELKNKELTAFTLKLIDKEETIDELLEKLKEGKTDKNSAKNIEKRVKASSTALWDEFNSRFIEVNADFYKRLQNKFPDLSPTERKHCALIKLNFSGKEMAHLLGISVHSVHVSRYRLRKRFSLEKGENLTDFIGRI